MPKNKWSAKDERKYEHIYEACVIQARRGGEKGATKTCKRIAAATVNRDRALMGLSSCGLGSRAERGGRCVFSGNRLERAIESVGPMDGWPDNSLATNQWAPVPMRWFRSKAAAEKWIAENPGDGRPKRAQNVIPPGWGMDGPKWAVYAQQFRGLGAVHPFHAPGVGVKLTAQSAADAAGDRAYYAEIGNPDNDDYRRSGPMTFDEAMARAQEYADDRYGYGVIPEDASVRHRDEAGREVHWVKRRGARGLGAAPKTTAEAIAAYNNLLLNELAYYADSSKLRRAHPGEAEAWYRDHPREMREVIRKEIAERKRKGLMGLRGPRRAAASYAVWNAAAHKWRRFEKREDAAAFARSKGETVEPLYRYKVHARSPFDDPGEVNGPRTYVAFNPEHAEEKFYESFLDPSEAESHEVTKVELAGLRGTAAEHTAMGDALLRIAERSYDLGNYRGAYNAGMRAMQEGQWVKEPWEAKARITNGALDITERAGPREWRKQKGLGAQALSLRLGGLRGPWQNLRSVDPNAEPGVFKKRGDAYAIITDGEDGDVELAFYQGRDMGTLKQEDFEIHDTFDAADRAAKRRGFDGLRGTPTQHAQQARMLMSEASSWGAQEGPLTEMEYAARASEEAAWSGDPDLERKADRFFAAAERGAKRRMG